MTYQFKSVVLFMSLITTVSSLNARIDRSQSAHRVAVRLENLDLSSVPEWGSGDYRERFRTLRDKKFLEFENEPRRIPWLYVRDGCHMRATHFIEEAVRLGYEKPMKVFVFGALEMKGNMIPHGSVEPWFHAAPIVKVDGVPMVLDPSVSFSRPLPFDVWADRIVKDHKKVIYSVCKPEAYLPTSNCKNPEPLDRKRLNDETQLFLKFERNILSYMGLSFKE